MPRRPLWVPGSLLLVLALSPPRGARAYDLVIEPARVDGYTGGAATVSVTFKGIPGNVQGWSVGVRTVNPGVARALSVEIGGDAAVVNGGAQPEFFSADILHDEGGSLDGDASGAVVDFMGDHSAGPAASFEALRIAYRLLADPGIGEPCVETELAITDTLGTPPIVSGIVIRSATVEPAVMADGKLCVSSPPPISLILEIVPEDGILLADRQDSETAAVRVRQRMTDPPCEVEGKAAAWSFNVVHDPGLIVIEAARLSPNIQALAPDFVSLDVDAAAGTFTAGVVLSTQPPLKSISILPPIPPTEAAPVPLALLTYRSAARRKQIEGFAPTPADLTFRNHVGDPPVDCVFTLLEPPAFPVDVQEFRNAVVMVNPITEPEFIRGDANANGGFEIADPIFILSYLFSRGDAPSCEDSADPNDSGGFDLADAIYLLSFLFSRGAPPMAPYPHCGWDRTSDSLGCADYPPCP